MNHRLLKGLTIGGVLMFLAISTRTDAQISGDAATASPLFATHDVLSVQIEAPMATLIRKRPDEEYLDGKFTYTRVDGTEQSLDLKIRTRGKYRRQKKTCSLPPIRLNFRKKQVDGTEFAGQDKLKLVTHCKTSERYAQLVLKEYLAYRMLQILTEKSFGSRLMQVTYIDTDGKEKPITRYGFVIEDKDDIGERIGLELLKVPKISYADLDPRQTNLINLYEYMIGNTDFSMIRGPLDDDCCHNNVLYKDAANMITPIPYDFDFAGLVDAPYAEPNPQFDIRSVRTRVYRGRCNNNQHLAETLALFRAKEADLRTLVNDLPGIEQKTLKQVNAYIDQFFETINEAKSTERDLIRRCS